MARITRFERESGGTVKVPRGPFAGLIYPQFKSAGSALLPKLTGRYESELSSVFEAIIQEAPETILDIGSAEGYYAVGLARQIPSAKVLAYDPDLEAQKLCAAMANINHVAERIIQLGGCQPEDLLALDASKSHFILCDCEGYEATLFTSDVASHLRRSELLIECHEYAAPGVSEKLIDTFASTHRIRVIQSDEDEVRAENAKADFFGNESEPVRRLIASEQRLMPQYWLHFSPRATGSR